MWLHRPDIDDWILLPCVRYREAEQPCADQWWHTDVADDPDLYRHTEELQARSAAESRLVTRRRAVRRDRKRLHDSTHLPMPATEASPTDDPSTGDKEGDEPEGAFAGEPAGVGGYTTSNRSPWSV